MINLGPKEIQAYLEKRFGPTAKLLDFGEIGTLDKQGVKDFGFGKPLLIKFEVRGQTREAVLSVMKGDKYGHQFYWDRAAIIMFQYEAGSRLDRHVSPLGLGYVNQADELVPLDGPKEFFILNEKLEGYDYFLDLERIRSGDFQKRDLETVRRFSRWLAKIHSNKLDDPHLYYRRIRNLLGSSECILGLVDEAFPRPYGFFPDEKFRELEKKLIDWRWKLKNYSHRLCAVHGDFHPWNVIVRPGEDGRTDFSVLDRSRGEWGDPAGDVASMAANYLLFGILDSGPDKPPLLSGPFLKLYMTFFEEYLDLTGDREILEVIAPFFVFRALVIASPEWYPRHPPQVRKGLFRFMQRVLDEPIFDYADINAYME